MTAASANAALGGRRLSSMTNADMRCDDDSCALGRIKGAEGGVAGRKASVLSLSTRDSRNNETLCAPGIYSSAKANVPGGPHVLRCRGDPLRRNETNASESTAARNLPRDRNVGSRTSALSKRITTRLRLTTENGGPNRTLT